MLTFEEWLDWKIQLNDPLFHNAIVVCPKCFGESTVVVERNDTEMEKECDLCNGKGEVTFVTMNNHYKKRCFTRREYLEYLFNDIEYCVFGPFEPEERISFIELSDYGYAYASRYPRCRNHSLMNLIVNIKTNEGFDRTGMSYKF